MANRATAARGGSRATVSLLADSAAAVNYFVVVAVLAAVSRSRKAFQRQINWDSLRGGGVECSMGKGGGYVSLL